MFQVIAVNSEGIESPSDVITSSIPLLPSAPLVQQSSTVTDSELILQVTIDVR